ncbi:MAG: CNNM domain-containing protein [Planctomycetia bacterium]|nr:CNNM domain-containing protein [Planctomycetia bacterium]
MDIPRLIYEWAAVVLLYGCVVGAVLVSGFYGGVETGAYRVNRLRLWLRAERGDRRAQTIQKLVADMRGLICVTLIGSTVGVYAATTIATGLFMGWFGQHAELWATIILAPVLFIFADITPKNLFAAEGDRWMYRAAAVVSASSAIFRAIGLVAILKLSGDLWLWLMGRSGRSAGILPPAQRLQALLRECAAAGVVTHYQGDLTEKVLGLRHTSLDDVMIPLEAVRSISADADRDALVDYVRRHRFSRVPIHDKDPTDIIGLVYVYDALGAEAGEFDLRGLAQPVLRLGVDVPISRALVKMETEGATLAVVAGHQGKAIGFVTINALVEEIVGESA